MIVGVTGDETSTFGIGEYSRRTGLSHKAIRLYGDLGLVVPIAVHAATGYRTYRADQVADGRLVGLLRGIGASLDEIGVILGLRSTDPHGAAGQVERHLAGLTSELAGRRMVARHIQAIMRNEELNMFEVATRHVPATRVLSLQRRIPEASVDPFVAEVKALFAEALGSTAPTGPFTIVFHGPVDADSDGPVEIIQGCPDHIAPTAEVGVRTEPAHDEAFTTITKAQWDFPAILAAYDAVACSPAAVARPGSTLSCREVYVAEPDEIGDDELVCDIAFPLG